MIAKNTGMIIRDNLLELLNGLSDERFICVCAPAGYGKTITIRQWLDRNSRSRAVLSLDVYDNNLTHFCERFCEALRSSQSQSATLAEIVSHPAFGGAPDEFTLRAIAAVSNKKRVTLVIDDLHFIHDETVLSFFLTILRRLPDTFQIVLISRRDLPAGFSDLWTGGSHVRISADHLRFSDEEIIRLYKKRGNPVTQEQAQDIKRFTGGWAIGISALLLSGGTPPGENYEYLEEFVRSDIWEKWDETTREFMLRTAAARELNPELCDALTGISDSEKLLQSLTLQGAFIFQTSDGIYHYHQLFHDFLRHMLAERGNDYLYPLLEAEGSWHLSRQDVYSAMDCFIQCENHDGIAKCFGFLSEAGHEYFSVEKLISIARVSILEKVAEKYPYIYSTLSWAAFNEGRAADMARYADLYYMHHQKIVELDPRLQLNIMLVRLIDFRYSLRELIEAPDGMPVIAAPSVPDDQDVSIGTINQNMPLLHRGTRDFSEFAIGDVEANIAVLKTALGGLFGSSALMLMECLLAGLFYEHGQLEKAHVHALAANAAISSRASSESKFFAMAILVCVLDAMGEANQAEHTLSRFEAVIEADKAYYLNRNFKALLTRRKLAKGDIKAAESWLCQNEVVHHNSLRCYDMYGIITTCRAYITSGAYDSAIILLTKVSELSRAYKRPLGIIEADVLLSIAYWKKKRGFQEVALKYLGNAVSLAGVYGYTQIFANEGAELTELLHRLQKKAKQTGKGSALSPGFIKLLHMSATEHNDGGPASEQPEQPIAYTDRQKTVMKLLCEGKSYKEIADTMGIKLPTLRSHISLIYKKLDVTSGTNAILKIKSSGILSD